MTTHPKILLLALFTALVPTTVLSMTTSGEVIGVESGDTISLQGMDDKRYKVRLYGIDCPELQEPVGQPFAKSAQNYTTDLLAGKAVEVVIYRQVSEVDVEGIVMLGELNVNRQLIEAGFAWQDRNNCKGSFCADWLQLEREARVSMRGLWDFFGEPVPPWEWQGAGRSCSLSQPAKCNY